MPASSTLSVRAAAESRRAVRKYLQQDVPEEDLREILRQVRLAPSPGNIQPWRFVVVREHSMREQLLAEAEGGPQEASARALIVLYADMEDVMANLDEIVHPACSEAEREGIKRRLGESFGTRPVAERQLHAHAVAYIALGFLLLAAEAMGYRTSSLPGFDPSGVKRLLGLPAHVTIPAIVAIGKGDEPGLAHHRHAVDRIARFV
ncbi:MAG TPA: nitroreductase family protein [Gemmatimonadales bacterium]|jgi:nitroreductase|nr:nitroreductase family protein [Gemmatimonadales bacterium]